MSRRAMPQTATTTRVYSVAVDSAIRPTLLFIDFAQGHFQIGIITNGDAFVSRTMLYDNATAYRALLLAMRALTISTLAPTNADLLTICSNSAALMTTSIHLAKEALDWVFQYVGWEAVVHIRDLRIQDMPRGTRLMN